MSQYLQIPTRTGLAGAGDKAGLIANQAAWTAKTNRDFLNKVRNIVKGAGSAEIQADIWFDYCCRCDYTREFADVFSHPSDTLDHGGDCDDLTILLIAGLMCIGIPACPDIVMKNGQGQHVRVRVGLPPHDPPKNLIDWKVLDPSKDSELRWVSFPGEDLSGQNHGLYTPKTHSEQYGHYTNYSGNVSQNNGNDQNVIDVRHSLQGRFSNGYSKRGNEHRLNGTNVRLTGMANLAEDNDGDYATQEAEFNNSQVEFHNLSTKILATETAKTLGFVGLALLGLISFAGLYVRANANVNAREANNKR